jgi:hypothetical protein
MDLVMTGYEIKDVHKGSDFVPQCHNPFTGRLVGQKKVEVK